MHGSICVPMDLGMYRGQNRSTPFWWKYCSSTIYALLHLLHEWFIDTDALKPVVDVVLIDFAKAYDHLTHNIIGMKLIYMDVPPILTQWVSAFLHNIQQRVKI